MIVCAVYGFALIWSFSSYWVIISYPKEKRCLSVLILALLRDVFDNSYLMLAFKLKKCFNLS